MVTPKMKTSAQHRTTFAKGGVGSSNKTFREQSAGPARAGQTGKSQTPAPGAKRAIGGSPVATHSVSAPSKAGRTGNPASVRKGR